MIAIRSLTVSVYVIRYREPQQVDVLLLERAKAPALGAWFQVTGRLEAGEAAADAARREMVEETGLVPDRLYAANWIEQWFSPESGAILLAPVFVGVVGTDAPVRVNAENRSARWMSLSAAIDLVSYPVQRDSLDRLRRDFANRDPDERLLIESANKRF